MAEADRLRTPAPALRVSGSGRWGTGCPWGTSGRACGGPAVEVCGAAVASTFRLGAACRDRTPTFSGFNGEDAHLVTLFGVSGDVVSIVVQIVGLLACFAIGASGYRKSLTSITLVIGLSANVLGQIVFAGGGPGACAGMVIIPLFCLLGGHVGRATWWIVAGRRRTPHVCRGCGTSIAFEHATSSCPKCGELSRCALCEYDLAGNVSGICPECGHQL